MNGSTTTDRGNTGDVFIRRTLVLMLLFACARPPEPGENALPPDLRNAEITVVIKNQHWLDVNVYLMLGSSRHRLGTAGSLATKVFSVPWYRIGGSTIRLQADPIGDRTSLSTEFLTVRPGSVVEWAIGSGLRQSTVSVY